ncbi:MAG: hypothetical protein IT305_32115 [Chloroflexi bacterium]|nr:hypothetical protein [Chloroflexota bacterium]
MENERQEQSTVDTPARGRVHLRMLAEIQALAVEAAGPIWPTPAMALAKTFERGAAFLEAGSVLPPLHGQADRELLISLNETRDDLLLLEALYHHTRYVTFALTEQSRTLEATWVALADRHLEIRSEIVALRREEERLKRELTALGGVAVTLPEHDDLPAVEGSRPRKNRELYATLFEAAIPVEVELDVAPATIATADRIARERGWAAEWGQDSRLLVFTHGLSLGLREREADSIDPDDDVSARAGLDAARTRSMGIDGKYSTLRFRLFELRHNNRILGWRITALEVEAGGMRQRIDRFREDRTRLEADIAERRAAGAAPAPPSDDGETSGDQSAGSWRRRIGRLLRGN